MKTTVAYYAIPCVLALYALRKYREYSWGWCRNKVKLNGKIAIVTGANSGIGYQVTAELLRRGATVILGCRNLKTGNETIAKLKRENPCLQEYQAVCIPLDLSSVISVKSFAEEVTKAYKRIDILVNNAGVAYPNGEKIVTQDGFEIHFGINHLGHFLLTNLLLPYLQRDLQEEHSRIVVVSSKMHEKGTINLNDLNYNSPMPVKNGYANSKLANVYFSRELAKKVKPDGINVYAVCPGFVYTSLFRHYMKKMWKYVFLLIPVAFLYMRTPKQGAQTIIYCITDQSISNESGLFYKDCGPYKSKHEFSDSIGETLWRSSENLLKPFNVL